MQILLSISDKTVSKSRVLSVLIELGEALSKHKSASLKSAMKERDTRSVIGEVRSERPGKASLRR